jgi:hypothetical protein
VAEPIPKARSRGQRPAGGGWPQRQTIRRPRSSRSSTFHFAAHRWNSFSIAPSVQTRVQYPNQFQSGILQVRMPR